MLILTPQKYLKSVIKVFTFSITVKEASRVVPFRERLIFAPQLLVYNYLFLLYWLVSILYVLKQAGVPIILYTDLNGGTGNIFLPAIAACVGLFYGLLGGLLKDHYVSIFMAVVFGLICGVAICIDVDA